MASQARQETDAALTKLEKKLTATYKNGLQTAQNKLSDYLDTYSYIENEMQAKVDSGDLSQSDFNSWKLNAMARGERWEQMCDTLSTDLTNTNQIAMNMVGDHMSDVYANNYNYQTYALEKSAQIDTNFTMYNHDTVERLVKDNPNLLPKPTVNTEKDYKWNKQRFNSTITSGILAGTSNGDIADSLSNVFGMSKNGAIRSARTATTSAENGGTLDSMRRMQDLGLNVKKQWMATLDDRTRDSHRDLDGETQELDDAFSNGLQYPADPTGDPSEVYNCRCTMVSEIDGTSSVDFSDLDMRASNIGDMTYDEWKAGHNYDEESTEPEEPDEEDNDDFDYDSLQSLDDVNKYLENSGNYDITRLHPVPQRILDKNDPELTQLYKEINMISDKMPNYMRDTDLESAKSIARASDIFFNNFPELKELYTIPRTHNDVTGLAMAETRVPKRGIASVSLNPDYFGNYDKLADATYNAGSFHPEGFSPEGVVIHELAHALDNAFSQAGVRDSSMVDENNERDASNEYNTKLLREVQNALGSSRYSTMNNVSGYATYSPAEWMAEALTEGLTNPNPRPTAAKATEIVKQDMKDYADKINKYTDYWKKISRNEPTE
jgi:SPP1 gp7 family putative phage head morphogenesis protein